jgi:CBS domain-containing protein
MKVRDCFLSVTKDVDVVNIEATIDNIINSISRNPASRSVYVVDDKDKLVGIISVQRVLNILGERYIQEDIIPSLSQIMAKRAKDIMLEPKWVSPEDDIEEALKIAVKYNLQDIPVVRDGRIVGNLDCFEIINNLKVK